MTSPISDCSAGKATGEAAAPRVEARRLLAAERARGKPLCGAGADGALGTRLTRLVRRVFWLHHRVGRLRLEQVRTRTHPGIKVKESGFAER